MTGVDRVEFAYLRRLVAEPEMLFGLVRSAFGYILLDRQGCEHFLNAFPDASFGPADRLSGIKRGMHDARARAESHLRRHCLDRCLPLRLGRMLRKHVPSGTCYLNTGHSNLTDRVLSAVKSVQDARVAVFVHDTIPLDYPQYQRPGNDDQFRKFLQRAGRSADLLICNSDQTEADVLRHLAPLSPQTAVAHLGVDMPDAGSPPEGPWTGQPFFVCLGTIEPRKNHELLLDIWPEIEDAHLLICGSRGWNNDAVFARLDQKPARVHELNGLTDGQIVGLMQQSVAALFPSLAEGYGLPPAEAAALGVPVICNDLPIYREILGNIPVYASADDLYLWTAKIKVLKQEQTLAKIRLRKGAAVPTWEAHFKTVLRLV